MENSLLMIIFKNPINLKVFNFILLTNYMTGLIIKKF